MGVLLVVAGAVVAVVTAVRLRRLGGSGVPGQRVAMVAEAAYLVLLLFFLAYHAARLNWLFVLVEVLLIVLGGVLVRVLVAYGSNRPEQAPAPAPDPMMTPGDTPPRREFTVPRPSLGGGVFLLAALTALAVVPVLVHNPAPATPVERASGKFTEHVDQVHGPAAMTVVSTDAAPQLADAGVPGGEAVPVRQYSTSDRQVTVLVAHHIQCTPQAVVASRDGGTVTVVVVAAPAPNAASLFPGTSARCAPQDPFTVRTAVDFWLPSDDPDAGQPITTITDTGANGPAARVP
ncbi:hypothetical protein ACQP2E_20190 [Actinoplanes sp. CA-015351]|uniref:hypothetical protein n=1 Tax=Actinoplanes sp. CA-015351 TaxID=3239897 RepID=UPI003D96CC71